jgi:protein-tyrosine phosphatase
MMPPSTATGTGPTASGIANLRDLGGHSVPGGGRVRHGLAFRSADLSDPAATMSAIEQLGIRTVYDLRTRDERESHPDRLPDGVVYIVADVLEHTTRETSPAGLMTLLRDPAAASRILGDGRAEGLFIDKYREFVTLDSARHAYHVLFAGIAADPTAPVLFHCTTGKDRTGWAAASLLLLLGVSETDVLDDYLSSNARLLAAIESMLAAFAESGGDSSLIEPFAFVRAGYLRASLDEVRATFGSIEAYFADGLGIGAGDQAALRAALIVHR